ncbi:MAG TPA: MBL fold metallo-hydrolase [Polyangiaceae bacterium]|nr:MBL fold metallo-hydrolase [Polyangiaceae bacterium]
MSESESGFEVIVLGAGDTFSEHLHPTALLLEAQGFRLAIDCPDSYRAILRHASVRSNRPLSIADIDCVLITHVHGDHMNGLEGFAFYKHFVEHKRVRLVASREVRQGLWEQRLKLSMGTLWDGARFHSLEFEDYFDYVPLDWHEPLELGPFRIRARRTVHHVPTSALHVECQGRAFAYSSDTAFDPELIRFLEPANLIFHETNYGPAHTPYESLLTLPAELRERVRLIHYSDLFVASVLEARAAASGPPPIQLAHEAEIWRP